MELGLSGKVALVTGSSRGIGRGIALGLAEEGCNVVVTARDDNALQEVASSIRSKRTKAAVLAIDLCEPSAAELLAKTVRNEFGRLDILVNNAGATKRGDFMALTDNDWQDGFALKLFAHVRLARAAWPLLKERRGSLITIAGTGARKPQASFTIGASVNAACAAFAKALADLGRQDGVQVNCIHPSIVDTDRQRRRVQAEMHRTGQPEETIRQQICREMGTTRFGTVEDVANLACFIVSKNGSWLHGASIDLDGGEISVL
jgi:3-oxoacyl-[acyl-carrier protein] reductase